MSTSITEALDAAATEQAEIIEHLTERLRAVESESGNASSVTPELLTSITDAVNSSIDSRFTELESEIAGAFNKMATDIQSIADSI